MKKRYGKELDVYLSHKEAKKFVRERGYGEFIEEIDKDFKRGLASASVHWEDDKSYICKMRGSDGDVVIGWEETHGKNHD